MKILITGGAGFIGSHLAEALARRGAQVLLLDNLTLGSERNLEWIRPSDAVDFVRGDAGDKALVAQLISGCHAVFHQAALPSVPRSVEEPVLTNHQNLDIALQLLVAARDAGVRRFLFASSSSVYGDSEAALKHENLPANPLSPYALQKYAAERYARMFHKLYGLPTVSLRYFNVFGPRQSFDSPYSGVIARFCTAFLHNQVPVILGDGLQTRDFTYVENIVAANLLALDVPPERVAGRVFNAASGVGINLRQLVADLNALTGRQLEARHGPPRPSDVRHSCADIAAAREALGYQPLVGWAEGLRRTLEWYRGT